MLQFNQKTMRLLSLFILLPLIASAQKSEDISIYIVNPVLSHEIVVQFDKIDDQITKDDIIISKIMIGDKQIFTFDNVGYIDLIKMTDSGYFPKSKRINRLLSIQYNIKREILEKYQIKSLKDDGIAIY